jgi:hypothetical protein
MDCNVVLIVLDTLREDHSNGLGELTKIGFLSYGDCISPAPWTGPSHISLFTGLMPSVHGIHESKASFDRIQKLSKEKLRGQSQNILRFLSGQGFTTYGLSCNPMISPDFGYDFHHYKRFNKWGEATALGHGKRSRRSTLRRSLAFIRHRKLSLAAKLLARDFQIDRTLGTVVGSHPLEKGSKHCLRALKNMSLQEPFFLFVNLMECHEPYDWDKYRDIIANSQYSYTVGKPVAFECNWRERYPKHVALGLSRMIEMLELLKPFFDNTLIIVTSDHGQLLGESWKYGHGLFLEDELLRVPLYVRYPKGAEPLIQKKEFVSLTSVPSIIRDVIEGGSTEIGMDVALAESFGPTKDIEKLIRGKGEMEFLNNAFVHKVKIYSKKGAVVYNKSADAVESSPAVMSVDEARGYTDKLPLFVQEENSTSPKASKDFTTEEEETIREHLRDLGYD